MWAHGMNLKLNKYAYVLPLPTMGVLLWSYSSDRDKRLTLMQLTSASPFLSMVCYSCQSLSCSLLHNTFARHPFSICKFGTCFLQFSHSLVNLILCIFRATTLHTQIFNTNLSHNIYVCCFCSYMFQPWILAMFRELQAFLTYWVYLATYYMCVYSLPRMYNKIP